MKNNLPVGKLPPAMLARLLSTLPTQSPQLVLGPGIGLDCAILDFGENLLAIKSEPITFATDEIGWYSVQIAANDIATTGATPRWLLVTLLLPEGKTSTDLVERISQQLSKACLELGIAIIGGHTEVTYGLDRPIINATLIGEVAREKLITPKGCQPGDRILLTKGVPVEATAILAREFPTKLKQILTQDEIWQAQAFLYEPGISVLRDAQVATAAGRINAMHDPTEGGIANALWELAEASQKSLFVEVDAIMVPELSGKICQYFDINPLAAIASGSLLLTVSKEEAGQVIQALRSQGISCTDIGSVAEGPAEVWCSTPSGNQLFIQPNRDEIARLFENEAG